jgi:hypothetical protein
MAVVTVVWNEQALKMLPLTDPRVIAGMDRLAARAVTTMKALTPVSPVFPVYAQPIPVGRSTGPVFQGRGLARPKGPDRSRRRLLGDLPLNVSGRLRQSTRAARRPDGSIIIGPTFSYAPYVNDGTVPHVITSHGPWPLRNRATGQVFGRMVHHPGTRAVHFVERTAESLDGVVIHI